MESELFGHRKGSFTGAVSDRKGLLEEAHRGILFLDEIGDMPPAMQVRLLRFLQGGEVRRIGESQERRVDVRVVVATHRSLETEVAAGRFRDDLYYRLNVVELKIPPLRDRPEDIPPLAEYIMRRRAARHRRPVKGFSPGAMTLLTAYHWPGNVRELENAIERALNLVSHDVITEADLPVALTLMPGAAATAPTRSADADRARLIEVLDRNRWNHRRAAASLGISRYDALAQAARAAESRRDQVRLKADSTWLADAMWGCRSCLINLSLLPGASERGERATRPERAGERRARARVGESEGAKPLG